MSAISEEIQIRMCIFTLERSSELDEGKQGWIAHIGKNASEINPSDLKTGLNQYINKNIKCIVAVHAHGAAPDLQTKGQCLYISDPGGRGNYENEQEYMQAHKDAQLNANEFADFLVSKGLPKRVQELQILACHSDVFAKDLTIALAARGFENTSVIGYKEEFSICQGIGGSSLAGLSPKTTPELFDKKGKMIWDNLSKEMKLACAADKHQSKFNTSDYIKHKKPGTSVCPSSANTSSAAAASLPSADSSQHSPIQTRAARAEAASIARMERARAEAEELKKSSPSKTSTTQFAKQQASASLMSSANKPKQGTKSDAATASLSSGSTTEKKPMKPQ